MNTKYAIVVAIVAIAIILGSMAAYIYLSQPLATQLAVQSGASSGLPAGDASWTSVSLLNTPDSNAYPIVSFTYLIVYKELNVLSDMTTEKATALVQFLWYVVHDGQDLAPGLSYAKLPANVVQIDETSIQSITFNGQHLQTT